MLLNLCQHRHSFEEQKVISHDECISYTGITGSFEGVTGGLMNLANEDVMFRESILITSRYILNKNL